MAPSTSRIPQNISIERISVDKTLLPPYNAVELAAPKQPPRLPRTASESLYSLAKSSWQIASVSTSMDQFDTFLDATPDEMLSARDDVGVIFE
jgi:hypothetical protein